MGNGKLIDGVMLTPLKIIRAEKGDIYHALKNSEQSFRSFGEAYFTTVKKEAVKAWKQHKRMTTNLVVPVGEVLFVLFDGRDDSSTKGVLNEFRLSLNNYCRLTVPFGVWTGFKGLSDGLNLVLNIADIPHDPEEQITVTPEENIIPYKW